MRRPTGTASADRAYVGIAVIVMAAMAGYTANRLWSSLDFWVWLAPVRELAAHPLHPSHPLLAVDAGDSYLGPYSLVLGLVVRLTRLSPVTVLTGAALANVALFLVAVRRLAARVSTHPAAPVLALLFTLLAWGWEPWRWSGYPNLNSLGTTAPLGSLFAVGTAMLCLTDLWQWRHAPSTGALVRAAMWCAITTLTHQPTGLWLAAVAVGFVLGRGTRFDGRRIAHLAVAIGGVGIAIVLWPYYSMIELTTTTQQFDHINDLTYHHVVSGTVLAWPGLVVLARRWQRDHRDPLAVAAGVVGMLFVGGWIVGASSFGRTAPGLLLMAHLAMADWFAGRLAADRVRRTACEMLRDPLRAALLAVLLSGTVGTYSGWVRSIPRGLLSDQLATRLNVTSYVTPNLAFEGRFDRDDVVLATPRAGLAIAALSAKVVAVRIPEPFIADAPTRLADTIAICDPSTDPARRQALLERYHPDHLVVEAADAEALLAQLPDASGEGIVNGFAILRLTP